MKKIFLATLMIVIATPLSAMDDDPDRSVQNIELATVASTSCGDEDESYAQHNSTLSDRPIHIHVPVPSVHIPPQNDTALNSIAGKLGAIRWQQWTSGLNVSIQTVAVVCMLCSVGDKISSAINAQKLECKCTCPTCPNINQPMAPTPMVMMRNNTMNSTDWNNTRTNDTTSYPNSTYSKSTATFVAMMNNMTKEKID